MNSPTRRATQDQSLKAYLWWATTVAWAATIFYLSTGTFGGSLTAWLLRQALDFLEIRVSPPAFQLLHNLLRKLAHLTEYAIYALLLYGSLGGGKDFGWRGRRAAWCVGIASIYSLTDEFHQSFVPERGGSILDSAIDTSGAVLTVAGLYVADRMLQARRRRRAASEAKPAET